MYPHERSLVKQFAGRPFAIVGVNSDPEAEMVRKVVRDEQITWRSFWDFQLADGKLVRISEKWNVTGWPSLFFIDHRGVIRAKNVHGEKAIEAAIEKLVTEAEQDAKKPPVDGGKAK